MQPNNNDLGASGINAGDRKHNHDVVQEWWMGRRAMLFRGLSRHQAACGRLRSRRDVFAGTQ